MVETIAECRIDGIPLMLMRSRWGYVVNYGMEQTKFDAEAKTRAAAYFHGCVAHALACAGHPTEEED